MVGGVSYHRLATATAVTALLAFAACSSDDGENAKADKPTAAKVTAGLPTGHLLYRRYLDDEQTQADFYRRAMELAACQQNVAGLLLFHSHDEPAVTGFQSGVYYVDGTAKSSLEPVRGAAERTICP